MENRPFGLKINKKKERDFYSRNQEKPVDLFTQGGSTISGDLVEYNEIRGQVILKNYIKRTYKEDGSSIFTEEPSITEISGSLIGQKIESSREERLGRIVKYNFDLRIEKLEQDTKLKNLKNKIT